MVRFKHRYLLVSLIFPTTLPNPLSSDPASKIPTAQPPTLSEGAIITLLRDSLSVNFGDVGAGEVGGTFSIKYLSPHTHLLILRVAREHFRTLWASLTLLRRLSGHEVVARVIHVSGTIRKTQYAAIAFDREAILDALQSNSSTSSTSSASATTTTTTTTTEAAVARDDAGTRQAEVEKRLKESEATILAMEA